MQDRARPRWRDAHAQDNLLAEASVGVGMPTLSLDRPAFRKSEGRTPQTSVLPRTVGSPSIPLPFWCETSTALSFDREGPRFKV